MIQPRQVPDDTAVQHSSRRDCGQSTHSIGCHGLSQVIEDFYDLCSLRASAAGVVVSHTATFFHAYADHQLLGNVSSIHIQGTNERELKYVLEKTSQGSLISCVIDIVQKQACRWHACNQSLVFIPLSGYVCAWMWLLGQAGITTLETRRSCTAHSDTHNTLHGSLENKAAS